MYFVEDFLWIPKIRTRSKNGMGLNYKIQDQYTVVEKQSNSIKDDFTHKDEGEYNLSKKKL